MVGVHRTLRATGAARGKNQQSQSVAVGWSDLDDQAATVDLEAALQPAGAMAFGPREQIAPGRPFAGGVAIAINPVDGRITAAWEERPGGVFTSSR